MAEIDPVTLTQDLVRCPSVTPLDEGALGILQSALEPLGFVCERLVFQEPGTEPVDNLYARWGTSGPTIGFAGHTDVVPVGDEGAWSHRPFNADIADGLLYGRGAADMKSGIAAFVAAAARLIERAPPDGSIALIITGDEEALAVNGTVKMVDWMQARGERVDFCLVGEPSSTERLGDAIKIGRRGSMNARLAVEGIQGHSAYPHLADNAASRMVRLLGAIVDEPLDEGSEHYEPSNLAITSIDIGNKAT
ncbi:MAG: succinyl-diaminopimelate desuccinylase, partial [Pseudomonadota bacterium]